MSIKQARPTEYKGIVYRSKSEAMFARYLELRFNPDDDGSCGFIYKPAGFDVGGWIPDFLMWGVRTGTLYGHEIPHTTYTLIEYKPSRPTATYIAEFAMRCETILGRLDEKGLCEFSRRCDYQINYGSVFSSGRGAICFETGVDGYSFDHGGDWLGPFIDEIRATRFDLEQVGEC